MPARFTSWLPEWAQALAAWMLQPIVLAVVVGSSILLFALSLVGVPAVLKRLPTDFFSRPESRNRSFWFVVRRGVKNALGCVLLAFGLLMLFVPGQGLLTILVALFLIDFPGKRRLLRCIISRPAVHRPLNALRRRAGRPPLELPVRS